MAVEAIVNSANTHFWMGGGLANAIKKAGGQEIEDEAIRQGPVDIGQAIITGAGELKARHVIHAVVMGQDLKTDEDNIRKASRSAFQLAEEKGIQSIGLPAMGTGVGGVSIFTSASVMIDEAISFLIDSEHIQHVTFALVDEEGREAFHAELLSRFSKGKS
ncbi:MAG: macro domain-containing protein [Candidatus Eisenbacteria sp.]|nr:macro domain-containing protein [Candidatus Eisenbacteria bacterium]